MRALPHLWAHRTHENPKAIALLDRALEMDTQYGLAVALCAWTHAQQIIYNWTEDFETERKKRPALIETAARHNPDDATGLTALATAIMLLKENASMRWVLSIAPYSWIPTMPGLECAAALALSIQESSARPWKILSAPNGYLLSILSPSTFMSASGPFISQPVALTKSCNTHRWFWTNGLAWPYRDLAVYRTHFGDLTGASHDLDKLTYLRPPIPLASITDGLKFTEKPSLERYIEGLRMAGME